MDTPNDSPQKVTIDKSGKYILKMYLPKPEWVKQYDDGLSARLFFKTAEGLCFSKSYGTKYGKSLAMLVGKISGKYVSEPSANLDVMAFLDYLKPATNIYFEVDVDVTPDLGDNGQQKEYKGEKKWKYKLNFPRGKGSSTIPSPTDW